MADTYTVHVAETTSSEHDASARLTGVVQHDTLESMCGQGWTRIEGFRVYPQHGQGVDRAVYSIHTVHLILSVNPAGLHVHVHVVYEPLYSSKNIGCFQSCDVV